MPRYDADNTEFSKVLKSSTKVEKLAGPPTENLVSSQPMDRLSNHHLRVSEIVKSLGQSIGTCVDVETKSANRQRC